MYPEYRKGLKDTYKMPATCTVDCGTPPAGGGGRGRGGAPAAPVLGDGRGAAR
jgi:hypothetical protein